mmetsp:Transcript_115925/g.201720  ORF Transcript_115925/g.201720 Transcript_115925/m.201720 type:complete len:294 (+) Transcript_115925:715-1596(+)
MPRGSSRSSRRTCSCVKEPCNTCSTSTFPSAPAAASHGSTRASRRSTSSCDADLASTASRAAKQGGHSAGLDNCTARRTRCRSSSTAARSPFCSGCKRAAPKPPRVRMVANRTAVVFAGGGLGSGVDRSSNAPTFRTRQARTWWPRLGMVMTSSFSTATRSRASSLMAANDMIRASPSSPVLVTTTTQKSPPLRTPSSRAERPSESIYVDPPWAASPLRWATMSMKPGSRASPREETTLVIAWGLLMVLRTACFAVPLTRAAYCTTFLPVRDEVGSASRAARTRCTRSASLQA